jgi:hypothetical protein
VVKGGGLRVEVVRGGAGVRGIIKVVRGGEEVRGTRKVV